MHIPADFDRTLNERGMNAAPVMADLLKEKRYTPELVISSPANRALTTAELFCDILGYPKEQIQQRIEIYEGGVLNLLKIVQQIPDNCCNSNAFRTQPDTDGIFKPACRKLHRKSCNLRCGSVLIWISTRGKMQILIQGKLIWYDYPKQHQ